MNFLYVLIFFSIINISFNESKMFAPNKSEFDDDPNDDDEYTVVNKTKMKLSKQNKMMQKYMKTNSYSLKVDLIREHKEYLHISGTKIVFVCFGDEDLFEKITDNKSKQHIDWRKEVVGLEDKEENFRQTISRQILVIQPAVEQDSGYYQCVIDNEVIGSTTINVWTMNESLQECLICMMILSAAGFFPFIVAVVMRYCFAGKRRTLAEMRKMEYNKRLRQIMELEKVEYEEDEDVRMKKEAEDYYAIFANQK